MSLHTKKEFADLCGLKPKHLSTYITRKKVIVNSKNLIDDTVEGNIYFLQLRNKVTKPQNQQEPTQQKNEIISQYIENKNENPVTDKKRGSLTLIELDKEKKLADLKKVEADTIHKELQIQKLQGLTIPTELVVDVVSQLSKSLISSFKDGADQLLIEVSKLKTLSSLETAQLRGQLIKIINNSSTKAITDARKSIKIIVGNYTEKREIGEHD